VSVGLLAVVTGFGLMQFLGATNDNELVQSAPTPMGYL